MQPHTTEVLYSNIDFFSKCPSVAVNHFRVSTMSTINLRAQKLSRGSKFSKNINSVCRSRLFNKYTCLNKKTACLHNQVVLNFISKKLQSVKLALATMHLVQGGQLNFLLVLIVIQRPEWWRSSYSPRSYSRFCQHIYKCIKAGKLKYPQITIENI